MSEVSAKSFLNMLSQSGIVEPDALRPALDELKTKAAGRVVSLDELTRHLISSGLITEWHCQKLVTGKYKGFFLGKYKLLRHLGTGGMSTVYLAQHTIFDQQRAIKVLPKKRIDDKSYLDRFYREGRAAASLNHKNIVRVYDIDNDGKTHYLVMEYVLGKDIYEKVKEDGPLEFQTAIEYTIQSLTGLQHAHDNNLVHRDIKPANLLVTPDGIVKILDLGLALFREEDTSLTVMHNEKVLGTADYLSPEQAVDSHNIDHRADIYSLGCTLYYMLTGKPPFHDGTIAQRIAMHQSRLPNSIKDYRPDCPDQLQQVCFKMMAKRPDDRYQTCSQQITVLRHLQDELVEDQIGPRVETAAPKIETSAPPSETVAPVVQTKPDSSPNSSSTISGSSDSRKIRKAPGKPRAKTKKPPASKSAKTPPPKASAQAATNALAQSKQRQTSQSLTPAQQPRPAAKTKTQQPTNAAARASAPTKQAAQGTPPHAPTSRKPSATPPTAPLNQTTKNTATRPEQPRPSAQTIKKPETPAARQAVTGAKPQPQAPAKGPTPGKAKVTGKQQPVAPAPGQPKMPAQRSGAASRQRPASTETKVGQPLEISIGARAATSPPGIADAELKQFQQRNAPKTKTVVRRKTGMTKNQWIVTGIVIGMVVLLGAVLGLAMRLTNRSDPPKDSHSVQVERLELAPGILPRADRRG